MIQGGRAAPAVYPLALLSLVSFFNYLDRMVIAVMVEPIKHDLQLSDTELGIVSGFAFALLYAICGIPLARVADRGSRKWLLTACLTIWSAMTALTGLARNFVELFAARMAVGVGEAGCVPAAHSMLGDLFPPERRAFAIGIFQAGGLLGLSVGLALAGIATERFGWRATLMGIGVAGLPLAVLVGLTMREPMRDLAHRHDESISAVLRTLGARRPLVHLIAGLAIGSFATYGIAQWLPAFFIRSHGASVAEVGIYGALFGGAAAVAGTVAGGSAMLRLRPRDTRWELWLPAACYLIALPLYAASFAVDALTTSLAIQFGAVFVASAGGAVALSAIQSFAEPDRRATAIAITMFLSALIGLGLGPTFAGAVSDMLTASFGAEALRYALIISTCFLAWAGLHFFLAAKSAHLFNLGDGDHAIAQC
jgi:predicted MFS family arabinose efflux permease